MKRYRFLTIFAVCSLWSVVSEASYTDLSVELKTKLLSYCFPNTQLTLRLLNKESEECFNVRFDSFTIECYTQNNTDHLSNLIFSKWLFGKFFSQCKNENNSKLFYFQASDFSLPCCNGEVAEKFLKLHRDSSKKIRSKAFRKAYFDFFSIKENSENQTSFCTLELFKGKTCYTQFFYTENLYKQFFYYHIVSRSTNNPSITNKSIICLAAIFISDAEEKNNYAQSYILPIIELLTIRNQSNTLKTIITYALKTPILYNNFLTAINTQNENHRSCIEKAMASLLQIQTPLEWASELMQNQKADPFEALVRYLVKYNGYGSLCQIGNAILQHNDRHTLENFGTIMSSIVNIKKIRQESIKKELKEIITDVCLQIRYRLSGVYF